MDLSNTHQSYSPSIGAAGALFGFTASVMKQKLGDFTVLFNIDYPQSFGTFQFISLSSKPQVL